MLHAAVLASFLLLTCSVSRADPEAERWALVTNRTDGLGAVSSDEEVQASSREECVRFLEEAIEFKTRALLALGRSVEVRGALVVARHPTDGRVVSTTIFVCRPGS